MSRGCSFPAISRKLPGTAVYYTTSILPSHLSRIPSFTTTLLLFPLPTDHTCPPNRPPKMMETYYGFVRTPADAIKLFEACRLGLLPRVQRRLSEKERQSIRSGSVFVWDEREAGMRRWTDGKSWSASRVSGSFLTYREMEGKRGSGFGASRRAAGKTPDSGRGSDDDRDDAEPDGYRYKADGLMKQSFSITTSTGQHLHLISYYSRPQPGQPDLSQPSTDPSLRHIVPVKGMYPESSMHEAPVPALTRAPMQQPPYVVASQHQVPPTAGPVQAYPPQYAQPTYSWPPSPVATPPYSHGHAHYPVSSYPHPQPPPPHPPPGHYAAAPPPGAPSGAYHPPPTNPPYERSLPPPQSSVPAVAPKPSLPVIPHGLPAPYPPKAARAGSPVSNHLQAQAREVVLLEPGRTGPNALPPLSQTAQTTPPMATPPPRGLSASPSRGLGPPLVAPPETNGTNGTHPSTNKASLSALLLHPTPTNSEPNSANPGSNSASSSPRAGVGSVNVTSIPQKRQFVEDTRALQVLDKKFCA